LKKLYSVHDSRPNLRTFDHRDPDEKLAIAQMSNNAATEKPGSAEHGDGATVCCYHDSNRQLGWSFSLNHLSGRSSNRPIF
jgi:hypothetical protein